MKRRRLGFNQTSTAPVPASVSSPAPSSAPPSSAPQPSGELTHHGSDNPNALTPGIVERPGPGSGYAPPPSGFHPGNDPGGSEMRNPALDRLYPEQLEVFNQPGCDLPLNPNAQPEFDRTRPYPGPEKARRLGFQSQENRIFDLPRGDAGSGQTSFRRVQIYSRLDDPTTAFVTGNPMFRALPLATSRSSDNRPRFWHISFFGIGRIDEVAGPPGIGPLPESEIPLNGGFVGPVTDVPGAIVSPLTPYIPQIATFQARAMIHDESGKRFIDVDVLGTRSFDVYAFSVTVFILVPPTGYEVDGTRLNDPGKNPPLFGLVQNAMYGARVVPIVLNDTNNVDQRTIGVGLAGTPASTVKVPIPPGARKVTVINNGRGAAQQLYEIDFDTGGPAATAAVTDQGVIVLDPATFRTEPIAVPNATAIRFRALGGAGATNFSMVYELDGQ